MRKVGSAAIRLGYRVRRHTAVSRRSGAETLLLPPRGPVRGRAAIGAALRGFASAGAKLKPVEILEIRSSGDVGVCAGTYVFEAPRDGGAPAEQRGKFVTIFMRQPDGSWNTVIDSLLGDAT